MSTVKPSWAEALIVAELEENTSDSMTDYFASRTVQTVALAWSKSRRDNFAEMRKAAATFEPTACYGPGCDRYTPRVVLVDEVISHGSAYWEGSPSHWHSELTTDESGSSVVFTTQAEAEAFVAKQGEPEPITFQTKDGEKLVHFAWKIDRESVEHREKYSMGHGYYLGDSRYSGWQVRKVDPSYIERSDVDTTRLTEKPVTAAATPTAAPTVSASGATVTINEEKNGVEIRFPAKPSPAVLDTLKAHGWRWSRFSSCWYHRDSPEKRAWAEALISPGGTAGSDDDPDDTPTPTGGGQPETPESQGFKVGGWINSGPSQTATKLRALADGMDNAIEEKMHPAIGNLNLTPRRIRIAEGMRRAGERLQQVQSVLRKLAAAHDDPTLWPAIEAICPTARTLQTKSSVEKLAWEGRVWVGAKNTYTPSVLDKLAGPIVETEEVKVKRLEAELVGLDLPGFFPTPPDLARDVVERADIQAHHKVLEPSAGKGDLAIAVRNAAPTADLTCVEINERLREVLVKRGLPLLLVQRDCLQMNGQKFDRIVMNPPFERGQDIEHVRHCFEQLLAPGGRLVAIVSNSFSFRTDHKFEEFRAWMEPYLYSDDQVEGAFTGRQAFRQTGVTTRILVLDKPAEAQEVEEVPTQDATIDKPNDWLF